ncbi:MAG: thioredoxin [Paludibacter sp.]
MKKLIFAIILLVAFLSACTGKTKESKIEDNQQTDQKMAPIHLTKAEFLSKVANFQTNSTEWKYLGDKPCIIDFYATWCGPCKMVAPILDDLAKEYNGQIYIYKVDVDAEPEIAAAYGIQSIPTIFICPMTGNPQVSQGAMQKEDFKKMITDVLLKK